MDQNGWLKGNTPSLTGPYPVQIFVKDQHGNSDTQSYTLNVVVPGTAYFSSDTANSIESVSLSLTGEESGAEAQSLNAPKEYTLNQNYPNPFNPTTTITYLLPSAGSIEMEVFNILGQKVCTLLPEQQKEAGMYSISWSGMTDNDIPLSTGVYFARLIARERSSGRVRKMTIKMLLQK